MKQKLSFENFIFGKPCRECRFDFQRCYLSMKSHKSTLFKKAFHFLFIDNLIKLFQNIVQMKTFLNFLITQNIFEVNNTTERIFIQFHFTSGLDWPWPRIHVLYGDSSPSDRYTPPKIRIIHRLLKVCTTSKVFILLLAGRVRLKEASALFI